MLQEGWEDGKKSDDDDVDDEDNSFLEDFSRSSLEVVENFGVALAFVVVNVLFNVVLSDGGFGKNMLDRIVDFSVKLLSHKVVLQEGWEVGSNSDDDDCDIEDGWILEDFLRSFLEVNTFGVILLEGIDVGFVKLDRNGPASLKTLNKAGS